MQVAMASTPSSCANAVVAADVLDGPLDIERLWEALRAVAARHPALGRRATEGGGPVEPAPGAFDDALAFDDDALAFDDDALAFDDDALAFDDVRGPTGDLSAAILAAVEAEGRREFPPASRPWRARLVRLDQDRHLLIIAVHRPRCDERSLEILRRDLGPAYARRPPADAVWWARYLAGAGAPDLPRDSARPADPAPKGRVMVRDLPPGASAGARRLATRLAVDLPVLLLAAFAVLLERLTGQRDLVIGLAASDRDDPRSDLPGLAETIGCPTALLPLRLDVDAELPFAALVRTVEHAVTEATAHRFPGVAQAGEHLPPAGLPGERLVRVSFGSLRPPAPLDLPGAVARRLPTAPTGPPLDLSLTVLEGDGTLALRTVHDPRLYRAARIGALLDSLVHLLGELVAWPYLPTLLAGARPPGRPLPDPGGRWSAAGRPAGPWSGLIERVRRRADAQPLATAARGNGGTLTYRQLDSLRTAIHGAVRRAGAGPGDVVAVLAARRIELPAILLGVLGTGARWLLLDPAHPPERLVRQVMAAGTRALLVTEDASTTPDVRVPVELAGLTTVELAGLTTVELAGLTTVSVDGLDVRSGLRSDAPRAGRHGAVVPPSGRGYLMSTSGTTGVPALVMASERPLERFLDWYTERFTISSADTTALLGGLAHDALLREALAPLLVGGAVCVPPPGLLRDPVGLVRWLAAEQVTILHLTPPLLRLLSGVGGVLPQVRLAVLAGDTLTTADVRALRSTAPGAVVVNGYGCTETPQLHAYAVVRADSSDDRGPHPVPVGVGVPGSQLLVLGRGGGQAAVGELGEVLIRSGNLADGYLVPGSVPSVEVSDRRTGSDVTAFGTNPLGDDPDDRVYRTGDLGRYDPAGAVVLAGRLDDQVKVRGHRVEPGEVEAALREHPAVAEAAVVVRPDATGETGLTAYLVLRPPGVDVPALRAWSSRLLPEYARPGALVVLPALPLTPNGKVDRGSLAGREGGSRAAPAGTAAGTATERLVIDVWQDVLGVPRIGAADNFFELGGHSLSVLAVHARLAPRVRAGLQLVDLFRYPTVRSLAAHLDGVPVDPGLARAAHRVAARAKARRTSTRRPALGGIADQERPT
jgi:amino acid adenylation domain-containing protein